MRFFVDEWWRLAVEYSDNAIALQRGPLALLADSLQLLLIGVAIGRSSSSLASILARLAGLCVLVASIYSCAVQRSLSVRSDATEATDTAWPILHAAVTSAYGLALVLTGRLKPSFFTALCLTLLCLVALATLHGAAVRIASGCNAVDVNMTDIATAVGWLATAAAYFLTNEASDRDGAEEDGQLPSNHNSPALVVGRTRSPQTAYHLTETSSAHPKSSLDHAPRWSILSFSYLNPLIRTGVTRQLQMPDLDPMPSNCDTADWVLRFAARLRQWRQKQEAINPHNDSTAGNAVDASSGWSLLGLLWSLYGSAWVWLGALQAVSVALSFAGPLVLNAVLSYLESDAASISTSALTWTSTPLGGLACALAMAGQSAISALVGTHMSYRTTIIQARMRAGLTAGIFRSMIAAPAVERAKVSSGALLNYISVDAQRLCDAVSSAHQLWSLPVQVAITLWLLYTQVGAGAGAGLVVLAIFIPVNLFISKRIGALTAVMMKQRDERVRVTGELLAGIKTIKMMAWEVPLLDRIAAARRLEFAALSSRKYLDAACVYLWASTPVLMSLTTFATVVLMEPGNSGASLSASAVFTTVSLLQLLIFPLNAFPWIITGMLEATVSLKRLQGFLCLPIDPLLDAPTADASPVAPTVGGSSVVASISGTFAFPQKPASDSDSGKSDKNPDQPLSPPPATPFQLHLALPDGSPLTVHAGETITVIGCVGSGKSALLNALLGELLPLSSSSSSSAGADACGILLGHNATASAPPVASSFLHCATSYAPQAAWIRGTSLRDNIVMGEPWDPQRYSSVLTACALHDDIATLSQGDASIISDTTLSGGQQQRVNLARALYSHSELVLLDDPISALDARIGEWVWRNALGHSSSSLLSTQKRARIIVTHDTRFLTDADRVVVLDQGRVVFCGIPDAMPPHLASTASFHDASYSMAAQNGSGSASTPTEGSKDTSSSSSSSSAEPDHEEGRQQGVIKRRVLVTYVIACGVVLSGIVVMSLLGMQLTRNGSDWWLSVWSAAASGGATSSPLDGPLIHALSGWGPKQFLTVFGAIVAANTVATIVRSWSFARACLDGARSMHDRLLTSVAYAPQGFHDVTPAGRLLNRFSADQYAVDETLPFMLNILLANTVGMGGTILVLTYATTGVFLVALPALALLYSSLQRTYRASSREIKRLDSVSRSPLYAHFNDCLAGAIVIRAHTMHRPDARTRALELEAAASQALMDDNQRTSFVSSMASQWLSLRLQGIGMALLALVAFTAVLLRIYTDPASAARPATDALGCLEAASPPPPVQSIVPGFDGGSSSSRPDMGPAIAFHLCAAAVASSVLAVAAGLKASFSSSSSSASSAGAAGLALSYSIPIVGSLNGLLNIFAETEKELVSVERIQEYIDVRPEGSEEDDDTSGRNGSSRKEAVLIKGEGHASVSLEAPLLTANVVPDAPAAAAVVEDPSLSSWRPSRGAVEFDHLSVRYTGTLRPALDGLRLSIAAGEKVALRGRTGSGKSTVISALWRLAPWTDGTIRIDGVDLRRVPRRALRSALAIIPQEPLLLKGSVRYNLDPTGRCSDDRLVWALRQCKMTCGLDAPVEEGGSNFSAGERQLLCLARALLADSKVVCIDEASANTDAATDALINEVLHCLFRDATMLIIAHRATGLAGCTRVVTLDAGSVIACQRG